MTLFHFIFVMDVRLEHTWEINDCPNVDLLLGGPPTDLKYADEVVMLSDDTV